MSTLTTRSAFYFGTTIDETNRFIDFSEGGPALVASLSVKSYSLTDFASEIKRAMDAAGALTYTVVLNRTTRKITISSTSNFSLLVATGSHSGNSCFGLMGFTGSDKTGASTYTSQVGAGKEYLTQYPMDKYVSPEHHKVKESAAVNTSAKGLVQTLFFGDGARAKMNIRVITNNLVSRDPDFYPNATGVADALTFLDFLITKANVEFMPDVANRNNYFKLLLDSTEASRNGIEYELQNMTANVYETGLLTFRKVIA